MGASLTVDPVDPASQAKELRVKLMELAQDQIKGDRTGPGPTSGTDHVQLCPSDVLRDETGLNLFISLNMTANLGAGSGIPPSQGRRAGGSEGRSKGHRMGRCEELAVWLK